MASGGVTLTLTGDAAKLIAEMNKVTGRLDEVQKGLRGVASTAKESREVMRKAAQQVADAANEQRGFADSAMRYMTNVALGWASATTAINLYKRALTDVRDLHDKAGERVAESESGMALLGQLAETPQQLKHLTGLARKTFSEGGAKTLDQAARTIFSLESAGVLDQRKLFSDLSSSGLVESPDLMARAGKTLIQSMGEGETGNIRDLISKAFAASKYAPSTAEEIMEAAARGGGSAKALGISDEELLAATAITSAASGKAERGGTEVASLLTSMQAGVLEGKNAKGKKVSVDVRGKSLADAVASISEMGMDGAQLQSMLGREEAVRGFRTLAGNLDLFRTATGEVQAGQAEDRVGAKLKLAETDPSLLAAQLARQTSNRRSLAESDIGQKELLADALQQSLTSDMRERGKGEMAQWAAGQVMDWKRWISGNEAFLTEFQDAAARNKRQDEFMEARGGGVAGRAIINAKSAFGEIYGEEKAPEAAPADRRLIDAIEQNTQELRGMRQDANRNQQAPPVDAHNE